MNIDRLIDRIEKALREGATDPVLHSLAKEYAKFRTQIDERLDHCVTLIRSGKDFAARELAEQPPDVLVLMEKLSFGNDAKWRGLCEEKGLYLGPNWSDDHVDLLNGLYDKEISEDSPLFREYRAAARSRDEDKTFKILKMILKANPDHGAARRHFGQLSVKILEAKILEINELIRAGREQEFLDLMMEIEETAWVVKPKGDHWENALAVRHSVNRRNAKARLETILVELATFKHHEDWKGACAHIGEFFELAQEFELEGELDPDDVAIYNEYKEWAEELADEAKAEKELELLVGRFKNRVAEMQQAEVVGGKTLEVYLEEQNELRQFGQSFQDIGLSVSQDVLMELQKAENHVKNRIKRLQGRTARRWILAVVSFVLLAAGGTVWFILQKGAWDARDAASDVTEITDPVKKWEEISGYLVGAHKAHLQDPEVVKLLDMAVEDAVEAARDNALTHENGNFRNKGKDLFLKVTQSRKLRGIVSEEKLKEYRLSVAGKMCEDVARDLEAEALDLEEAVRFVEMFHEEPEPRMDANGKPLPLDKVDYSVFYDGVKEQLESINAEYLKRQDATASVRNRFDRIKSRIKEMDEELIEAYQEFRDTGKVNHAILGWKEAIDGLSDATKEFAPPNPAVDAGAYRLFRDGFGKFRDTWRGYVKEVENTQGSKIDELLDKAERLAASLRTGNDPNPRDKLAELGEMMQNVSAFNKGTTEQLKLSSGQTRRLNSLMASHREISASLEERSDAVNAVRSAAGLEEYIGTLEKALAAKAYDPASLANVRNVVTNRGLFENDKGQLQTKLLFKGPNEVWNKAKAGEFSLRPEDTRPEFEHLSALVGEAKIRDAWLYKLYECSPVRKGANVQGVASYSTEKTLSMFLTSVGPVQEERIQKKFDAEGKPIANPSEQLIQQGNFVHGGAVQGRLFETVHFNGGVKGFMLEEGSLTPESRFVQFQVERRLDKNTKSLEGSLLDLLQVVYRETTVSPLFKGFLHGEICELMLKRPEEWGVSLCKGVMADYEAMKQKTGGTRLKADDWILHRKNFATVEGALGLFYTEVTKKNYAAEAKYNVALLKSLTTIGFGYAGHMDEAGRPKFNGEEPLYVWGLGKGPGGSFALQRMEKGNSVSGASGSAVLPFSPLLTTDVDVRRLFEQAHATAGAATGQFASLDKLLPFEFSD